MKKILSVVLTILLMLSIVPIGFFGITASAETTSDGFEYFRFTKIL